MPQALWLRGASFGVFEDTRGGNGVGRTVLVLFDPAHVRTRGMEADARLCVLLLGTTAAYTLRCAF